MESAPANAAVPVPTDIHEVSVQIRKEVGKDFELDVTVTLPSGITILFGASGAGKTTLLDCVAGLAHPDSGILILWMRVGSSSETTCRTP